MSAEWPSATGSSVYKALLKLGFEVYKVDGSHHVMFHPDDDEGRLVHVSVHSKKEWRKHHVENKWKEVHAITGVSTDEFKKLLRKSK